MDRVIVYPGSIPLDTHILQPQRNAEIALGMIMRAAFGTGTIIDGLAVTQQASPNMTVQVGQGSVITQTVIDPTGVAFGSLALDSSTNLVKIGVNTAPVNMSALTAPAVAGQSQNWLIEAQFLEADGSPIVSPYYDAANPSLPYTGPANAGTSQNSKRTNTVQLQWKAGTAATTGTQNTPSPDSGWTGIAVVTVANGQATIVNANITQYANAPIVPTKLPLQRTKLQANLSLYCSPTGSDTNSGLSAATPFATLQKAWNTVVNNYDLNGFVVTINAANGTYTTGLNAQGAVIGNTLGPAGVLFVGNTGSPTSCLISCSTGNCFAAANGAGYSIAGFQIIASTGYGLLANPNGTISINGSCNFGACGFSHMLAQGGGYIVGTSNYTISGGGLCHWQEGDGVISVVGVTITLTGTPAFTSAFANATLTGAISCNGNTFTGSATGQRYSGSANGVINTNGAATTYLPGSTVGAVITGAQYV